MRIISRLKSSINKWARSYGYNIERIVDYGANKLDVFDLLVESLSPSDPEFYFVQVGANDGMTGDPIVQYVKRYHWNGLLLEPQPKAYALLADNYSEESQLVLENAALAESDGTLSLYTVKGSDYLATIDRSYLKDRVKDVSTIEEITVEAVTFGTLADRYSIRRVDLLIVDTEGFDYEVIKMALEATFPLPRLIQYEHLHLSPHDRTACVNHLASVGYKLHREGGDT